MNPIFIVLVAFGAILLWFLLSFAFRPIGKVMYRIWKNACNEINKKDCEKEKDKK